MVSLTDQWQLKDGEEGVSRTVVRLQTSGCGGEVARFERIENVGARPKVESCAKISIAVCGLNSGYRTSAGITFMSLCEARWEEIWFVAVLY
jgi:hypothetical protein